MNDCFFGQFTRSTKTTPLHTSKSTFINERYSLLHLYSLLLRVMFFNVRKQVQGVNFSVMFNRLKMNIKINKQSAIVPDNIMFTYTDDKLDVVHEEEDCDNDDDVNTEAVKDYTTVLIKQLSSVDLSSADETSSVFDDLKTDSWMLYVQSNPIHQAYGSDVYIINATKDLNSVSFVSSYPTMLQTYKPKLLYVQYTSRALELKRLVYEQLHMFQIYMERPLFKCRLELIISVIEQCTKDMFM